MDGTTTIKNDVLVKIAVTAAMEVSGVEQVGASSVGRTIAQAFGGGKTSSAGVGVKPGQPGSGEVSFGLTISTQYGYSIPNIVNDIRQAVGSNIKEITGLNVKRVDIHVEDIKEASSDGRGSLFSLAGEEGQEKPEEGQEKPGESQAKFEKSQAKGESTEIPQA